MDIPRKFLKTRYINNTCVGFYQYMGPHLSRRDIVKELGFPVWDDDGKHWIIGFVNNESIHNLVGFVAWKQKDGVVTLNSAWVRPDYRRHGVYTQLADERMNMIKGPCVVRVVAKGFAAYHLQAIGFHVVAETKQFVKLEKEIA